MGQLIAARRKALGLTQMQLAGRLGVTDRAVSRWERGVGAPEISLLAPLAAALEITTDELLGNPPPAEKTTAPTYIPTKIGIPMFYFYVRLAISLAGCLIMLLGVIFQPFLPSSTVTAVEMTGTVIVISGLLSTFLLYRCPRCGHFLEGFNFRASQYQIQHCRTCGQHLYSDKSVCTLKEYRTYKKAR